MTEPIATPQDLARELLARLPDRLAHTEGVARRAEEAAVVFEPDEAAALVAALGVKNPDLRNPTIRTVANLSN